MKQYFGKFLIFGVSVFFMWQCQPGKNAENGTTTAKIAQLEEKLYGQQGQYINADAMELMKLYLRYADSLPDDPQSPDYIFKAADISLYQQPGEATIAMYDRILKTYPKHEHAPMCLFFKAFVYDNRLNDTASAHRYYNAFIASWPEHDFADDAAVAIRNLGKSPEELIREFEAQNEGVE